jgi:transcriptional regulator with XRE-family HTH domain
MQHRGEIIKEAIYKSGYPITELAKRMGKSRRWVYLLFENATVSIDLIINIGIIIHYDFSKEIEGFQSEVLKLNESPTPYLKGEDYWKNKYLNLLEEYNELLKKEK